MRNFYFFGFPDCNDVHTLSVTDLLSEAMEQNPSRKSNGHSASQTIPRISGNQEDHYYIHKKRPSLSVIPSRKCPHT
jgi:hypothetical protein